jgi:hypothetical protein
MILLVCRLNVGWAMPTNSYRGCSVGWAMPTNPMQGAAEIAALADEPDKLNTC